jgi:hypothetical protein
MIYSQELGAPHIASREAGKMEGRHHVRHQQLFGSRLQCGPAAFETTQKGENGFHLGGQRASPAEKRPQSGLLGLQVGCHLQGFLALRTRFQAERKAAKCDRHIAARPAAFSRDQWCALKPRMSHRNNARVIRDAVDGDRQVVRSQQQFAVGEGHHREIPDEGEALRSAPSRHRATCDRSKMNGPWSAQSCNAGVLFPHQAVAPTGV